MPLIPLFVQNEVEADAADRLSAFNFCNPFDYILPFADGTISALDRRHLWGMYTITVDVILLANIAGRNPALDSVAGTVPKIDLVAGRNPVLDDVTGVG